MGELTRGLYQGLCLHTVSTSQAYVPASVHPALVSYKLRTRCVGHSSTITHLDWSLDSTVIQSNDQAYEVRRRMQGAYTCNKLSASPVPPYAALRECA